MLWVVYSTSGTEVPESRALCLVLHSNYTVVFISHVWSNAWSPVLVSALGLSFWSSTEFGEQILVASLVFKPLPSLTLHTSFPFCLGVNYFSLLVIWAAVMLLSPISLGLAWPSLWPPGAVALSCFPSIPGMLLGCPCLLNVQYLSSPLNIHSLFTTVSPAPCMGPAV